VNTAGNSGSAGEEPNNPQCYFCGPSSVCGNPLVNMNTGWAFYYSGNGIDYPKCVTIDSDFTNYIAGNFAPAVNSSYTNASCYTSIFGSLCELAELAAGNCSVSIPASFKITCNAALVTIGSQCLNSIGQAYVAAANICGDPIGFLNNPYRAYIANGTVYTRGSSSSGGYQSNSATTTNQYNILTGTITILIIIATTIVLG